MVSEAGASVYSASEFASRGIARPRRVRLRGAVSIARRLQDPLAELVKIDPKSSASASTSTTSTKPNWRVRSTRWSRTASTRSASTSTRPRRRCWRAYPGFSAGAGAKHRELSRRARRVPHPRRAARSAAASGRRRSSRRRASCASATATIRSMPPACTRKPTRVVDEILAAHQAATQGADRASDVIARQLNPQAFADDTFGVPHRDGHPAPSSKSPAAIRARRSRSRASTMASKTSKDLQPGMMLEGTVTNVAQFGAFVDLGVHQDGLVHISAGQQLRQDRARGREAGRHRQGEGARGRPGAQAHRADDEARR